MRHTHKREIDAEDARVNNGDHKQGLVSGIFPTNRLCLHGTARRYRAEPFIRGRLTANRCKESLFARMSLVVTLLTVQTESSYWKNPATCAQMHDAGFVGRTVPQTESVFRETPCSLRMVAGPCATGPRRMSCLRELAAIQLGVGAARGHELRVVALLDDGAVIHD